VASVFETPLLDLLHHAAVVHRMYNDPQMVSHSAPPYCGCPSRHVTTVPPKIGGCLLPRVTNALLVSTTALRSPKSTLSIRALRAAGSPVP